MKMTYESIIETSYKTHVHSIQNTHVHIIRTAYLVQWFDAVHENNPVCWFVDMLQVNCNTNVIFIIMYWRNIVHPTVE